MMDKVGRSDSRAGSVRSPRLSIIRSMDSRVLGLIMRSGVPLLYSNKPVAHRHGYFTRTNGCIFANFFAPMPETSMS